MNRKHQTKTLPIPVFLAKASGISERAARAMRPNGIESDLANKTKCNVITLHDRDSVLPKGGVLATGNACEGQQDKAERVRVICEKSEGSVNER